VIAYLRGRLLSSSGDVVVIETGGVGFRVQVTAKVRENLPRVGQMVELYTYMNVRENDISLCGFATEEEQSLFRTLLGVSGVGPRTALAMLSAFSPDNLRNAISAGDIAALSHTPGVGRRTAERLVLDLKGRLGPVPAAAVQGAGGPQDDEVIAALMALGYSQQEAVAAVVAVPADVQGLDNRILQALRGLSSR